MGFLGGVRNPAGQLFHVELTITNPVQREDFTDATANLLEVRTLPLGLRSPPRLPLSRNRPEYAGRWGDRLSPIEG